MIREVETRCGFKAEITEVNRGEEYPYRGIVYVIDYNGDPDPEEAKWRKNGCHYCDDDYDLDL